MTTISKRGIESEVKPLVMRKELSISDAFVLFVYTIEIPVA